MALALIQIHDYMNHTYFCIQALYSEQCYDLYELKL